MKKMLPGEQRFIARQIDKLWRVYDRARGSYPYSHPDLGGTVLQDVDKSSAEAEAERLNTQFGDKPKLERKSGASKKETVEVQPEEVDIPDLPDYGEPLTEQEAAAYEDGLIEKVTY